MITEPEMEGAEDGPSADVLDWDERAPGSGGGGGRRPWLWAVGGVAAASLVWAAVLQGTGADHKKALDLHGYRLPDTLCTPYNLEPLTDRLSVAGYDFGDPSIHRGSTLDHGFCTMTGHTVSDTDWAIFYTISVTVDLHRKTDPRAEFRDIALAEKPALAPGSSGTFAYYPDSPEVTTSYPGLGDQAYFTTSAESQSLHVRQGGAVISVGIVGAPGWIGKGVPTGDFADPPSQASAGIPALHPLLPKTILHLMGVLSAR